MANSVDPDQTAPSGSGTTLFAYAILSATLVCKILGHLSFTVCIFDFSGYNKLLQIQDSDTDKVVNVQNEASWFMKIGTYEPHHGKRAIKAYANSHGSSLSFLFLFLSCPSLHRFCYLFCPFSPFLWETTQNDP